MTTTAASYATWALLGDGSPICFQVAIELRMRCCGPERVTSLPPPFGAGDSWRAAAALGRARCIRSAATGPGTGV